MANLNIECELKPTLWWRLFCLSISLPPVIFNKLLSLFKRTKSHKLYVNGKFSKYVYLREYFK